MKEKMKRHTSKIIALSLALLMTLMTVVPAQAGLSFAYAGTEAAEQMTEAPETVPDEIYDSEHGDTPEDNGEAAQGSKDSAEERENAGSADRDSASSSTGINGADLDGSGSTVKDADSVNAGTGSTGSDGEGTEDASANDAASPIEFKGKEFDVTIDSTPEAGLPADTDLKVTEITGKDKKFEDYYKTAVEAVKDDVAKNDTRTVRFARFYDFELKADGEALEPEDTVNVTIDYSKAIEDGKAESADKKENVKILHFTENEKTGKLEAEVLDRKVTDATIENTALTEAKFEAESFSVYAVVYTVDFHYGDGEYDFSIAGESSIMLSEMIERLHIGELTIGDVKAVEFSDPDLIKVEKKTAAVDAEDGTVPADDWKLTSLKAFDTDETLTLTLNDGEEVVVKVTDAHDTGTTSREEESCFMVQRTDSTAANQEASKRYFRTFGGVINYVNTTLNSPARIEVLDNYTFDQNDIVEITRTQTLTIGSTAGEKYKLTRGSGVTGSLIAKLTTTALTINNLELDNKDGSGALIARGGANSNATLTMTNVTLNGSSGKGYLIHGTGSAKIELTDCELDGSTATNSNSLIYRSYTNNMGDTTIINSTIKGGSIGSDLIYIKGDTDTRQCSVTLTNCVIDSEKSTGSVLKKIGTNPTTITGTTIIGPTVSSSANLIDVTSSGALTITDTNIYRGSTTGAAVSNTGSGTLTLSTAETTSTISGAKSDSDSASVTATSALIKQGTGKLTIDGTGGTITVCDHKGSTASYCAIVAGDAVEVKGNVSITDNKANNNPGNLKVNGNKIKVIGQLVGTIGVTSGVGENNQFATLGNDATGHTVFTNDENAHLISALTSSTAISWISDTNKYAIDYDYYKSLKEAVAASGINDVIRGLISEDTLSEAITITKNITIRPEDGIDSLTLNRATTLTGDMITTSGNLTLNSVNLDGKDVAVTGSLLKVSGNHQITLTDVTVSGHNATNSGICAVDANGVTTTSNVKISGATSITGNKAADKAANLKVAGTNRLNIPAELTGTVGITTSQGLGQQFATIASGVDGYDNLICDANDSLPEGSTPLIAGLKTETAIYWYEDIYTFYVKAATGNTYCETLKEAVEKAENNNVIVSLVDKYTMDEAITTASGKAITIQPGSKFSSLTLERGESVTGDLITAKAGLTLKNVEIDGKDYNVTGSVIKVDGNFALTLTDTVITGHKATNSSCAVDASVVTTASYVKVSGKTTISGNKASGKAANLKVNGTDRLQINGKDLTGDIGVTTEQGEGTQFATLSSRSINGHQHFSNDKNYSLIPVLKSATTIEWVSDDTKYSIGYNYYKTLKAAADAAATGNTILSLVSEDTIDEQVVVKNNNITIQPGKGIKTLTLKRGDELTGDMIKTAWNLTLNNINIDGQDVAATGSLLKETAGYQLTLNNVIVSGHKASSAGICAVDTSAGKILVNGKTTITGNLANQKAANVKASSTVANVIIGDLSGGQIGITTTKGNKEQFATLSKASNGGVANLTNDTNSELKPYVVGGTKVYWGKDFSFYIENGTNLTYFNTFEDAVTAANAKTGTVVIRSMVDEYTMTTGITFSRAVTVEPDKTLGHFSLKRGNVSGDLITSGEALTLNNLALDGESKAVSGALIKVNGNFKLILNSVTAKNHTATDSSCAVEASAVGTNHVELKGATEIIGNTANGNAANLHIPDNTAYTVITGSLTKKIGITTTHSSLGDTFATWSGSNNMGWNNLKNDAISDESSYCVERSAKSNGTVKWKSNEDVVTAERLDDMYAHPDTKITLKTAPTSEDLSVIPDGAVPGTNNDVPDNPYMVWKSTVFDENSNSTKITMNYFQKQVRLKLDFIFLIDETGTMANTNETVNGFTNTRAEWARYAAARASKGVLDLNDTYNDPYNVNVRVDIISYDDGAQMESGFMDNYDDVRSYVSSYGKLGGGTNQVNASDYPMAAIRASRAAGRLPVLVWMGDMHVMGSARFKSAAQKLRDEAEAVYALMIYESGRTYISSMSNLTPKAYQYFGDPNDGSKIVTPITEIIQNAIDHCGKNLTMEDKVSAGVAAGADLNGITSTGPGTIAAKYSSSANCITWDIINGDKTDESESGEIRARTGQMYTKTVEIPMTDDVYSGSMNTNIDLTVIDNGVEENMVEEARSPILKKAFKLKKKTTDTSGAVIEGAVFKLEGANKTWDNLTSNANGEVTVPWAENDSSSGAAFKIGSVYKLTEMQTADGKVRPGGSWTLNVGNDYKITATTNPSEAEHNRTNDLQAKHGMFEVYNDIEPSVKYDANNGLFSDNTTVKSDAVDFKNTETQHTYTIRGTETEWKPTRTGHAFAGWNTKADGTGTSYVAGEERNIYRSDLDTVMTLYAQWRDTAVLTVTKTASGSYADTTGDYTFSIDLPADKSSYTARKYTRESDTPETITFNNTNKTFSLKADEKIVIEGIPLNKEISVEETGLGGISSSGDDGKYKVTPEFSAGTAGTDYIDYAVDGTKATFKLMNDATLGYTNHLNGVVPSGLKIAGGMLAFVLIIAFAAFYVIAARRRRSA